MAEASEQLELHHMCRENVYDFYEGQLSIYKHGDGAEVWDYTFKILNLRNHY
jgi:hypothetical protein